MIFPERTTLEIKINRKLAAGIGIVGLIFGAGFSSAIAVSTLLPSEPVVAAPMPSTIKVDCSPHQTRDITIQNQSWMDLVRMVEPANTDLSPEALINDVPKLSVDALIAYMQNQNQNYGANLQPGHSMTIPDRGACRNLVVFVRPQS